MPIRDKWTTVEDRPDLGCYAFLELEEFGGRIGCEITWDGPFNEAKRFTLSFHKGDDTIPVKLIETANRAKTYYPFKSFNVAQEAAEKKMQELVAALLQDQLNIILTIVRDYDIEIVPEEE